MLECTIFHVVPNRDRVNIGETWHVQLDGAKDRARHVAGGAVVFEYTVGSADLGEFLVTALMGAGLPAKTRVVEVFGGSTRVPCERLRVVR